MGDGTHTLIQALKKQMTKLAVHSVGSRVVELLFATFPAKSIAPLKLELYGPQYALFATSVPSDEKGASNTPSLPSLAAFIEQNPTKQSATLEHLQLLLQKGLDKSLTGFGYFHSLLLDYTSIAKPNDVRSFLTPALAEHSLHLLSTRAGTKVVCECFAYATVKDRKKMIKCLKGYARSSLLHRDAYLAVLRMVDVMDDTVLLNKTLLAELHRNSEAEKDDAEDEEDQDSPILDLVQSDTGHKLFLLLLVSKNANSTDNKSKKSSPKWMKYLDPYEVAVLHRNPTVEENGELVPTSKKEDETRRSELLVYVRDLLSEVCTKHAQTMMRNKHGSKVLLEVCENCPSEELFASVVKACKQNDGNAKDSLAMYEDPVGHLALKNLFLNECERDLDDDEPSVARLFFADFKEDMQAIATTNRGAFVLSALAKTCVGADLKKALKTHKKSISELAKGKGKKKLAGCAVLLESI